MTKIIEWTVVIGVSIIEIILIAAFAAVLVFWAGYLANILI